MQDMATLKPNVASFGYAAFLSISATSIWGGIFPYLATEYQTSLVTIYFYVIQIALFWLTFCAAMIATWLKPTLAKKVHVLAFSLPLSLGPLLIIASMYFETASIALIVAAAVLIGIGSAGYMMSWQRVFASLGNSQGNLALISGTGYSALIYFCICFIPAALTAYLIPLVLVPLAGLCLWLSARKTNAKQPMFEDIPKDHSVVYRNAIRESVFPALSIGALGFCSGAVRFIAITHQELLSIINIFSMFALMVIVIVFFWVWRNKTIQFDLLSIYRILFPLAATCLIVLPFAGGNFTNTGIAITYACFMLATVLMMMHCGQISRDSGINPVFIYAFYGTVAYLSQMLGYVIGYVSGSESVLGVEQLSLVSLVALYVMLLASLFGRRRGKLHTNRLEFLMLTPKTPGDVSVEIAASEEIQTKQAKEGRGKHPLRQDGTETTPLVDKTSKRCQQLSQHYNLSTRETEVMELIARGYTGPTIADMLFISENTMRTHSKRIYAKLGIHKNQELLALLNQFDAKL